MPRDRYQSALAGRYPSEEMLALFSDDRKYGGKGWRKVWLELARAEKKQGAPITNAQIKEIRVHLDDPVDYALAGQKEALLRHDVIAHVGAFGQTCPKAAGIIGLGATSCDTTDNVDLYIMREGLQLIEIRLARVIDRLTGFGERYKSLPTLGSTHMKAAALTTVGKRACMWAQNFLMDLEYAAWVRSSMRFRGLKGATGTQASFLELFDGDHARVKAAEKQFAKAFGFNRVFVITGQTYPRKVDSRVTNVLAEIAASASKMATDLRLLIHDKEMDEPFEATQKGSFGMPWKRNPMRSERACSLSRLPVVMSLAALITESIQMLERSLDDSAARRTYIAESFLAVDAILKIVQNVAEGLIVYPKVIERHIREELPFMVIEKFLIEMVKAGANRQVCHARLRDHSVAADQNVKQVGGNNDLLLRLRGDDYFAPIHRQIDDLMDPTKYVGRAAEQVDEFIEQEVAPALVPYVKWLGGKAQLTV